MASPYPCVPSATIDSRMMPTRTTSRRRAHRAAALTLLLVASVLATRCRSKGASPIDSGADVARGGSPDAGLSCGTVQAAGTTPTGAFAASRITAQTNGNLTAGCPDFTARITVYDDNATTSLTFAITVARVQSDSGVVTGPSSPAFSYVSNGNTIRTSGTVNVIAADAPPGVVLDASAPIGHVEGTFSLSQDGFSLSGAFSTTYCMLSTCFGGG